jgi:hypothetical protein
MFHNARVFNGDLSVEEVRDMSHMFDGASSFSGDLGAWSMTAAVHTDAMFRDACCFDVGRFRDVHGCPTGPSHELC